MPHAHRYIKQETVVEAIQVHPSNKSVDLESFCSSLRYTSSAGIHFPQEGRPEQEHPNQYFFSIQSREGKVYGYLYDWIVKEGNRNFQIVSESEFATNYKTA